MAAIAAQQMPQGAENPAGPSGDTVQQPADFSIAGNAAFLPGQGTPYGGEEREMGLSIFQHVGNSLAGGPNGIHPPTLLTALAAIAGFAAQRSVARKIAEGTLTDDFERLSLTRTRHVIASEHVNRVVLAMDRPSIASILTDAALRLGAERLPQVNALVQSYLEGRNDGSDGYRGRTNTVLRPDMPAETLLMMYWETTARFFANHADGIESAPFAAAHALCKALSTYRDGIVVAEAVEQALMTAIGMSKIDRSF